MLNMEKNYTLKIFILFLATGAGIFSIWYALIRQESADWVVDQISHQVSPYAVTETKSRLIISNVLIGYSFNLPNTFKTAGARNLNFFMGEAAAKKCEIKHFYFDVDKAGSLISDETKLIIPARRQTLVFELANKEEKNVCARYLSVIKNNLTVN